MQKNTKSWLKPVVNNVYGVKLLGLSLSTKSSDFHFSGRDAKYAGHPVFFEETFDSGAINVCRQRMLIAVAAFILIYTVIVLRVFNVCLVNGIKIHHPDVEAYEKEVVVTPFARADVTDRNGTILATSLPTVNLFANPKHIRNPEDVAEKLSLLFPEIGYDTLIAKLTRKKTSFVMIKYNLSPAQQSAVNSLGIPALEFQKSEKRIYPHKNLFSHILGFTNIDNLGLAGIEKFMHNRLTESSKPLALTLDMGIQDTIREELIAAVKKFQAVGASAILMDVNSGEIMSMVSVPDYDPNLSIPLGQRPLFNFATQGVYEAGSVFKTFNTALGLESGHVKVNDKFDATKPMKVQNRTISDYRGENRWLTVGEILIYSSNIGSVRIINRVGKQLQRQFMINMGFSEPLKNFEVHEKGHPLFTTEENWQDVTMATVSYGYGISVTPLHLITAFSSLINGGLYHYPTIVKSGVSQPVRRVISEQTSDNMRKLLRDVVIYGSGKSANVPGYQVLGKTGTANKLVNGHYIDKKVMTTFLAAFPASEPRYALLVVMDEPKAIKETWGFVTSGWNAVPTGGKIIAQIAPQLNIQADFDLDAQRQHVKASFSH